jgi:hypothetical protein
MLRALGESSDGGFLDDAGMDAFEREARGKARTRVVFAAGPWDSVRSQVETELTNHDLPVSTDGNNAVFEVRGTVRLLSLAQSQLSGAIIAELQADVAIGYVGRAESIASLQVREKGAGRTETDATLAAEKKLAARLGRNASDELTKHLAMHDKR